MAVMAGLALGCEVRGQSRFARKNYFYPDLAKGYQISQFELPLNENGTLGVASGESEKRVRIQRIHMEEDAAKNLHGVGGGQDTLVDFNRAGVPLIEIVTDPDLGSALEAESYLKRLREILMFLGVNDGNLEEGSFRCDANVSIRPVGQRKLGVRTELKNINSFRFVKKAIEYEIARHESILSSGGSVIQETRSWNESQGKTLSMRSKEEAHDYRYFPDPDLPPLRIGSDDIERLRRELPELPKERRGRWGRLLGLLPNDAEVLSAHPRMADFFDDTAAALTRAWGDTARAEAGKKAANFIQSEVLRHVHADGLEADIPITSEALAELLVLVRDGTINGKIAKEVFSEMVSTGAAPRAIVKDKGLTQVTDESAIREAVESVLAAHPGQVQQYRAGKTNLMGFFVGQVMKASKGKANPKIVNQMLRERLEL